MRPVPRPEYRRGVGGTGGPRRRHGRPGELPVRPGEDPWTPEEVAEARKS